jgi:plastocyanin
MSAAQKILLGAGAGLLISGALAWVWGDALPSLTGPLDLRMETKVDIVLTEEGFSPREVRISRNTTVRFSTNRERYFWPASNLHPSHDIYPAFDPGRPLTSEESWEFVFEQPGVWGFHDHVRSYYTGILYVE